MINTEGAAIAIIEDDHDIGSILKDVLKEHGFRPYHYTRADEFETSLNQLSYALCLVDLGLPDQNGLDLVSSLSSRHNIPCIIISGRRQLSDKIVGLELGADDYIAKPFEPSEIIARVRSVLRRVDRANKDNTSNTSKSATCARFDKWTVDFGSFEMTHVDGSTESLSSAELDVLRVFIDAPNRLLTRAQILDSVTTDDVQNFDRAVDVRISRLRAKLRDNSQNPKLIKTIYGAGYIFVAKVELV